MITLFGIKNCDTIKKARNWLTQSAITYRFHDYRIDGLDELQLKQWSTELGWQQLLNTRGTTWRKLADAERADLDEARAIQLMLTYPALIKRPLLDTGAARYLGFDANTYEQIFNEMNKV